jgi:hypothetical protein
MSGMFRKTNAEWQECVDLFLRYQAGEITSEEHDAAQRDLEERIRERVCTVGVVVKAVAR